FIWHYVALSSVAAAAIRTAPILYRFPAHHPVWASTRILRNGPLSATNGSSQRSSIHPYCPFHKHDVGLLSSASQTCVHPLSLADSPASILSMEPDVCAVTCRTT
ncbi:hypothetical protein B0H14DRAFT_2999439, partial [Mycena olivaceomarginata]